MNNSDHFADVLGGSVLLGVDSKLFVRLGRDIDAVEVLLLAPDCQQQSAALFRVPEALADHMAANPDPDRYIEKILIELICRRDGGVLHKWAVEAVGGDPLVVRRLAGDLVAVHANEYRDAKRESDRVERECGF